MGETGHRFKLNPSGGGVVGGGVPIAVSTPRNWDSLWQPFFGFGSFVFTQIIDCCGSPFKLHIFYLFFPRWRSHAQNEQTLGLVRSLSASPETTAQPELIIL